MRALLALLLLLAAGTCVSAQDLADNSLLERLQSGGLVILFRHGKTGPNPDRPDAIGGRSSYAGSAQERQAAYLDCDRQRVLSETGREGLRQIADAFRRIGLVVDEVYASPMCRTRESAWLLVGQVTWADSLIGRPNPARDRLVRTIPADGSNRILVTHSYVISSILSMPGNPIGEGFVPRGFCVVLEPNADGEFRMLARLGPDDWTRLARHAEH